MADLYGPIAQNAAKKKDVSYSDFLEEVLRAEREAKRCRAREMLTCVAGFPTIKSLDDFDFGFATGAPKAQIQELHSALSSDVRMLCCLDHRGRERRTWRSRSAISPPSGLGR
jgi:DNA replication protein DnaC